MSRRRRYCLGLPRLDVTLPPAVVIDSPPRLALRERLAGLWRRLTEPAPAIQEPERRRARMLSSLLLPQMPLGLLATLVAWLADRTYDPMRDPFLPVSLITCAILATTYAISRTERYQLATMLTVGIVTGGVWSAVIVAPRSLSQDVAGVIVFVALGVLLGSILLSIQQTALLATVNVLAVLLLPLVVPDLPINRLITPLAFIIATSILHVIAATLRNQDLRQIQRAQRLETAGLIAHDLNNLLTPLSAYPELIADQLPPGHPAIVLCERMRNAALQISAVNEDMLALGRRGSFDRRPTDLNRVIDQVLAQLRPAPSSLRCRLKLTPDLRAVNASDAQLVRVVANLIINARDAMLDDGLLTISTSNADVSRSDNRSGRLKAGPYARLDITDTGPGIPAEIRESIFETFFTTKTKAGSRRQGSGLGLSVVQAIVADHGGHVELASDVGRGTTFSVYLPACDAPLPAEPSQDIPRGSETVLVVADEDLGHDQLSEPRNGWCSPGT